MKVALVAQPIDQVLPPHQFSMGLIVFNSAVELAQHADVTLYAKQMPHTTTTKLDLPFSVVLVPAPWDDLVQKLVRLYPRWAGHFRLSALADEHQGFARAVAAELDQAKPDVVHVMNFWSLCRRLRGRNHRRRLVLEMQSEWLSQMDPRVVAKQLSVVDAVVAVSDHIAKLFRSSFPSYGGLVATVYNGVDMDVFRPLERGVKNESADGPHLLFVGRVSPEKGVHTLIKSFKEIAKHFPTAKLDIVGPRISLPERFLVGLSSDPLVGELSRFYDAPGGSNYQDYLDQLIRQCGLENSVYLPGGLPHKQLVAKYRAADIVVNPSLSESFGISVVEGMACGIPVVGTGVGGMLETIVDGVTGRIVPPEDPEALARAVIAILENRDMAARMASQGRQRAVEQFSWRARAQRCSRPTDRSARSLLMLAAAAMENGFKPITQE